jgi:hypothetical protein
MQGGYALAKGLPRRCAPRNDNLYYLWICNKWRLF